MSGLVRICGRLSNEASQDTEGNPVYVFLDDARAGYDAWMTPKIGDTLVIYDQNQSFRYDLHVPLKERNFGKFNPPIRTYWFDKGYKAELFTADPQYSTQSPGYVKAMTPPPLSASTYIQVASHNHRIDPKILTLLSKERDRQNSQHGGPAHDDTHTVHDWFIHITRQMGKLSYPPSKIQIPKFHLKVLTKIAAIAIAGMESIIRKNNL